MHISTQTIPERPSPPRLTARAATSGDEAPCDRFRSSLASDAGLYRPMTFVSNPAQPQSKVGQALADPKVKAQLARFPAGLQQSVSQLNDRQLQVLHGGIQGTTQLGPISIDNREAFINGRVMLKSIWGNVHDNIKAACHDHKLITPQEEKPLHGLIDKVSDLSKAQRKELAALLDRVKQG